MTLHPLFRPALVLAAGLALAGAATAQQAVVPGKSEIGFTIKEEGVPVSGHFRTFSADLAFDPKKPEAAHVRLAIDTGSATMGAPETDAEIPKPTWFDAARFPKATFVSTAVHRQDATHYAVDGTLTIKGTARPVSVPLLLAQAGGTTTASGQFTVHRLAFRLGEGDWADPSLVADEVQVRFRLAVTGVAPL